LEDVEAIKKLKALCCLHVDLYDAESFADLFVEDGIFMGAFQRLEGRDALRGVQFWPFMVHYVMNPIIDVRGDHATGKWYFFRPYTDHERRACWASGRYEDDYVRLEGEWKFKVVRITNFFAVPYDEGWSKSEAAVDK
jgi:hypothetical protein